ncbi:hypothetical protein [Neptuniibacter sp. QD37_11]|uniref:hypothetical protein n=1 Tax=Neptuniibacter sp. QD37_11 TaxID=3398209 RepID=UPI0039F49CCB
MIKQLDACEENFKGHQIYLSGLRGFFKEHGYKILLKRSGEYTLPDSDEVWKPFLKRLNSIFTKNPEHFMSYCPFGYVKTLLSIKHIRSLIQSGDELPALIWHDGNFIDVEYMHANRQLGTEITLSSLKNIDDIYSSSWITTQYRPKEVVLALVNLYDFETGLVEGDWEAEIERREERKETLHESYLSFFEKIWTPRQLSKAFSEEPQKLSGKLTKSKWEHIVRQCFKSVFKEKGAKTYQEAFSLLLTSQFRYGFGKSLSKSLAEKIHFVVTKLKTAFPIYEHLLEQKISEAIYSARDSTDGPVAKYILTMPNNLVKGELRRIKRMKLSRKTIATYEDHMHIDGLMRFAHDTKRGIYDLHIVLSRIGVNHSTIRNLITQVFSKKLWIDRNTQDIHDHATSYLRNIFGLADAIDRHPCNPELNNKIFKLLTSEIGGGGFNAATLRTIKESAATNHLSRIKHNSFNSLSDLISTLLNDPQLIDDVISMAEEKRFIFDELECRNTIKAMTLGKTLSTYLNQVPKVPEDSESKSVISQKLGPLSISLYPHNHLIGALGAAVPGVCIGFTSNYHRSHLREECQNLIVHDGEKILLWGLVVKAECGAFFLNNFQGSLPSRYAKFKSDLVEVVQTLLSGIGNVYLMEFGFNAVSLAKDLMQKEGIELHLPKMRLDVPQDDEGWVRSNALYKIPASESAKLRQHAA